MEGVVHRVNDNTVSATFVIVPPFGKQTFKVRVEVDLYKLATQFAPRVLNNKGGKSVTARGAVAVHYVKGG